jgi:acyl carrier protein phosphodiesterase
LNFLAHLLLSGPNEELAVGNFLADMLHPREYSQMPKGVMDGVRFHQEIDRFTDSHHQVLKSKSRVRAISGKYAPVLIDVYFDLVVFKNWTLYATISFEEFEEFVYSFLLNYVKYIPVSLQWKVTSMVKHQWLRTYQSEEGIRDVFRRMAVRASKPEVLINGVSELISNHDNLDEDFKLFFPALINNCSANYPLQNTWINPSLLNNKLLDQPSK